VGNKFHALNGCKGFRGVVCVPVMTYRGNAESGTGWRGPNKIWLAETLEQNIDGQVHDVDVHVCLELLVKFKLENRVAFILKRFCRGPGA
jgi:hypothetical protein